jgi:hypothetical protein
VSERARKLAERFEQVGEGFAAEMEGLSEAQWRSFCPDEGRTVAALAYHVGWAYPVEIAAFRAMALGEARSAFSAGGIDEVNARHGAANAACDQAETVRMLRSNALAAAAIVRELTDEQLERTGAYVEEWPTASVQEWIERVLIGHPVGHQRSIRAAVG